jgi:hypothetical protein
MSASQLHRAQWLDRDFWDRLDRLESLHRHAQSQQENAQRNLERLSAHEAQEVRQAWQRYCEVIAELDRVTTQFEDLHQCVN